MAQLESLQSGKIMRTVRMIFEPEIQRTQSKLPGKAKVSKVEEFIWPYLPFQPCLDLLSLQDRLWHVA
jgi:hypothetical protein